MKNQFEDVIKSDATCGVFPIDINLKNFLVTDRGTLYLLNIPIFAYGPLVHGAASVVFQMHGQGLHTAFAQALYPGDPRDLALFETYNALGVIAFYARKGPEAVQDARIWGGTRTLLGIQIETAEEAGIL